MVHNRTQSIVVLAAFLCLSSVAASNPIAIKGTKFFDPFIKGMAYQPRTLASSGSRVHRAVGAFKSYSNTLGFFVGNEVDMTIMMTQTFTFKYKSTSTAVATTNGVDRTRDIASYSIPVFLSEFSCNVEMPRTFPEGPSIFGSDMTGAWSGGIVYEWSQERDSYGLIQVDPDNTLARLQQSEKQ
ncbi:1,3-beta-glucanosyltransferase gas1 [Gamsiella multidivaricata]|nr:1,3-beta-glucanosyltransferase gas1 [Gamsiella multidivaricata]